MYVNTQVPSSPRNVIDKGSPVSYGLYRAADLNMIWCALSSSDIVIQMYKYLVQLTVTYVFKMTRSTHHQFVLLKPRKSCSLISKLKSRLKEVGNTPGLVVMETTHITHKTTSRHSKNVSVFNEHFKCTLTLDVYVHVLNIHLRYTHVHNVLIAIYWPQAHCQYIHTVHILSTNT